MPIKHLKPRNKAELKSAKVRDLKEKEESLKSISKAFQKYMNGEYSMNQAINSLNLSGIHVSVVRRSAGSEGYDISANIGGDTVKITVTPNDIIKEGIKHLTPRENIEEYNQELQKYTLILKNALHQFTSGEKSWKEIARNLYDEHDIVVISLKKQNGVYLLLAQTPVDEITVYENKTMNEGIKHLGPKSEKELRDSVKGLSFPDKLEFAKKNKLDWLKKEAEEDLKKNYKDLPMEEKFRYATNYNIGWLKKAGEEDFKKGIYSLDVMFRYAKDYDIEWLKEAAEKKLRKEAYISPVFKSLHEKLQEVIGQKFDYEIHYHFKNYYDLRIVFQANGVHFLIQETTRDFKTPPPEIKYAKNLDGTFFFTDGTYLTNTNQMMSYIKRKIKESKQEN